MKERLKQAQMVLLGLHGDGVLLQGRMNQSTVNFITVNLLRTEKLDAGYPESNEDS